MAVLRLWWLRIKKLIIITLLILVEKTQANMKISKISLERELGINTEYLKNKALVFLEC